MRALLELLAPDGCVSCGATSDGELCAACATHVRILDGPLCGRCGDPRRSEAPCPCGDLRGFGRARSLVVFAEPARSLTLALKRRARPSSVGAVGDLLSRVARREGLAGAPDLVVTHVPAGRAAAKRGFDHAGLIARATADALGVPAQRLLARAREGPRQADVRLDQRRANVRGRFAAKRVTRPVLLVDDVYTTGATAEACAIALTEAGAPSVDVLTWARTLRRRA